MKQTDISEFVSQLGLNPSPAQIDRLLRYEEMLSTSVGRLGLISRGDRPRIRERHILDCSRAAAVAPESGAAFDLGSGGGLPGIVVAILQPGLTVTLVERRSSKAGFLKWAVRALDLPLVRVFAGGTADLPHGEADLCFARALAPLAGSWAMAEPLLRPGGRLVYFAGANAVIPGSVPGAADIEVSPCEMLESSGPLVIITR